MKLLTKQGFYAENLRGGMVAWDRAGLPVRTGTGTGAQRKHPAKKRKRKVAGPPARGPHGTGIHPRGSLPWTPEVGMLRRCVLVLVALVLTGTGATAEALPSWPQYGADAERTGEARSSTITVETASTLHRVWSRALGSLRGGGQLGDLPAGLVVDGRTVFVTGEEALYALRAGDGRTRWRLEGDAMRRGIGGGELATGHGVVYVVAADPLRVVAVDTATGEVLWETAAQELDRSTAVGAPVLTRRRVFLSTREMEVVGSRPGQVAAVDLASRGLLWTRAPGVEVSPAAAREALAVSSGGGLRMLDPGSGRRRWSIWLGGRLTSPAVRDGTIYVGRAGGIRDNLAIARDAGNAAERWRSGLGMWRNPSGSPALGPATVLLPWWDFEGAGGGLAAFDRVTGRRLWIRSIPGLPTSPVLANGVAIVAVTEVVPEPGSEGGSIGRHGRVMAFVARTGRPLWAGRADGVFLARPVVAGNAVYVVSRAGTVIAFRAGA